MVPGTHETYRAAVRFSVLGSLHVENGDGRIEIRGAKERTLLAHLVSRAGQMVPAADLVDSLWGEAPPRTAGKALQTYVLRLRNALEPDRGGVPTLLVTEGPGYRLDVEDQAIDARRFDALLGLAHRSLAEGQPTAAEELLGQALALWRGPAYAGFESAGFAQAEGRRLEELRLTALEDRWSALLEVGRAAPVVPQVERFVREHPLRERAWGLLILGLYRSGRQGEALQAYDRARTVLADELGVDPGPELQGLHRQVLAQDSSLVVARRGPHLPPGLEPPPSPILGRERELDVLREAWRRAELGEAVTTVVRGPSGAGASRLAAELAQEVARGGTDVSLLDGPDQVVEPVSGGSQPRLVVADHVSPPDCGPSCLVVVLAGERSPVPPDADVVDLGPLDEQAVAAITEQYTGVPDREATQHVLVESGGWPGRVHEAALGHARRAAVHQVSAASQAAGRSSASLASAQAELSDGVQRLAETSRRRLAPAPDVCPWKGLESYDVGDASWFAGRERLVAELVARLAGHRLIGVVGASGSGKSSAIRAGLLAALAEDVLPGSSTWRQILLRPGAHPMQELARKALGTRRVEVGDLLAHMIRGETSADDARVMVVVDQLEELWTACDDEGERDAFLDVLAELAVDPTSPVTVVLAVRADYVGELADHAELAAGLAGCTVLVGAPSPAEVRRAVERPAHAAGLRLEEGLTDAIVGDAGSEPGLLPLLSTSLRRLWQARQGRDLTLGAYVEMGGLDGAIASLAEDAYASLPHEEQVTARTLLVRLAGPGEGTGVTRRRVALEELEALPRDGVRDVVRGLAAARLLTVSDGHVEVAHEALFREWPRLRGWLAEDASGRAVQRRLAPAASEWDSEGREPTLLWRGTRLAAGLDVADLRPQEITPVERDFLEAGRIAAESERREIEQRAASTARENRRLRWLLVGLAVVLVLALVAGLLALRSRAQAEESRVAADAKRIAASALNEERRDLALLSAVEAVRMEQGPETYGALLSLLARAPEVVTGYRTPNRFLRLAAAADGRTVLVSENEPVVRGLDAVSGDQRWQIEAPGGEQVGSLSAAPHGDRVFALSFSPATAGVLLDADDGSVLWRLPVSRLRRAAGAGFEPFLFSHAGWRRDGALVLASASHVFEVDPRTGEVVGAVAWPEPVMPGATFHVWPDGRVSFGGEEGSVPTIFDPERPQLDVDEPGGVVLASSPSGDRILTSTETAAGLVLRIHDSGTLRPMSPPLPANGFALHARWSGDASTLAVSVDDTVQIRDGRTGEEMDEVSAHSGASMEVGFAGPRETMLWSAGRDGTAVGVDLTGRRSVIRSTPVEARPHGGTAAEDADLAVTVRWTEGAFPARLLDTATGDDLFGDLPMTGLGECICQVAAVGLTPDGRLALGGTEEFAEGPEGFAPVEDSGHLVVWDTSDGTVADVIDLPWPVYGVDATPDSASAVVQGRTGVAVVDLATGEVKHEMELPQMEWIDVLGSVEVSPSGELAVLGRGSEVVVVDVASGEVRAQRVVDDEVAFVSFAWSDDGASVAAGGFSGRVSFLSASDLGTVAPRRQVSAGFVIDLEASPVDGVVASMGSEGDVRLWDSATWQPYGQPVLDDRTWGLLSFTDSGELQVFYESGERHTVETSRDAWLAAACATANRDLTADESAVVRPGVPPRPTCDDVA